jgi:hypothetical protein
MSSTGKMQACVIFLNCGPTHVSDVALALAINAMRVDRGQWKKIVRRDLQQRACPNQDIVTHLSGPALILPICMGLEAKHGRKPLGRGIASGDTGRLESSSEYGHDVLMFLHGLNLMIRVDSNAASR